MLRLEQDLERGQARSTGVPHIQERTPQMRGRGTALLLRHALPLQLFIVYWL